jgi:hypothetical protein
MFVSPVFLGISFPVSLVVKTGFPAVLKSLWPKGLSDKEIAEKMLGENGILDVKATFRKDFLVASITHEKNR